MKNRIQWLCLAAIAVIVLLVLCLPLWCKPPASIVGTFCSGEQILPQSRYLTLYQDGSYLLYRQFEPLEEGSYAPAEANLYVLHSAAGGPPHYLLYDAPDQVYYLSFAAEIESFVRISQTPSLVNLTEQGDGE